MDKWKTIILENLLLKIISFEKNGNYFLKLEFSVKLINQYFNKFGIWKILRKLY